jgi:tetratricopeptide (TPR) repeat protein
MSQTDRPKRRWSWFRRLRRRARDFFESAQVGIALRKERLRHGWRTFRRILRGDEPRSREERWRHFRSFLLGLPAFTAFGALVALAHVVVTTSPSEVRAAYHREGMERFESKDFEAARVCFERIALLYPADQENRYQLALTLGSLKETSRAVHLMNNLAPLDGTGFAPAHLRLAQRDMAAAQTMLRPDFRTAEIHLKAALELKPTDPSARALLGQLYSMTGRPKEAEKELKAVVKDRPDLLLLLAQVCRAQGQTETADSWANEALRHWTEVVKQQPNDPQARSWLAFSECAFHRYPEAETILLEPRSGPASPVLRRSLSQVYALWYDWLHQQKRDTVGPRMALLQRGLRQDPNDPGLLQRMANAVAISGPEADKARDTLRTVLATGQATGIIHMILGLDAWARGQAAQAELHWEQANRLCPESPFIANNLAWVLALDPKPDLPRALALVDRALKQMPNVVNFHDTRGFILLRMKRWKDALPHLELALQVDRPRPQLHRALAEAYDNLKLPEMAAKHRQQAEVMARPGP